MTKELQLSFEQVNVDTTEMKPVYLIVVNNQTYIRLSKIAFEVLRLRSQGVSFELLASELNLGSGNTFTPEYLTNYHQNLLDKISSIDEKSNVKKPGFLVEIPLLETDLVEKLAKLLSMAFSPLIAIFLIGFMMCLLTFNLVEHGLNFSFQSADFFTAYGLFLISLFFHELGHASACSRFGVKPGSIGFTIYLIYPAFYADVSIAWKLKRWERVLVDLGGVYFQLIVAAFYALLMAFTGWSVLSTAIAIIIGSCVFSLNPIFKFDGYWVVSDAFGVTNLSKQPGRIAEYIYDKFQGRTVVDLPWPQWVIFVLSAYSLISITVWLSFVIHIFPLFIQYISSYPQIFLAFFNIKNFSWLTLLSFLQANFMIITIGLLFRSITKVALGGWSYFTQKHLKVGK